MNRYLLLLYESPTAMEDLSPEEIQSLVAEYTAWRNRLSAEKRLVSSNKLKDDGGKILQIEEGSVRVTDGPFSEVKEIVGGYFLIEAESYEAALEISKDCPHLSFGGRIELREIDSL